MESSRESAEKDVLYEIPDLLDGDTVRLDKIVQRTMEHVEFFAEGVLISSKPGTLPIGQGRVIILLPSQYSADLTLPQGHPLRTAIVNYITRQGESYVVETDNSMYLLSKVST